MVKDTIKYDVLCLEQGDIDYLLFVADQLSSDTVPPHPVIRLNNQ